MRHKIVPTQKTSANYTNSNRRFSLFINQWEPSFKVYRENTVVPIHIYIDQTNVVPIIIYTSARITLHLLIYIYIYMWTWRDNNISLINYTHTITDTGMIQITCHIDSNSSAHPVRVRKSNGNTRDVTTTCHTIWLLCATIWRPL